MLEHTKLKVLNEQSFGSNYYLNDSLLAMPQRMVQSTEEQTRVKYTKSQMLIECDLQQFAESMNVITMRRMGDTRKMSQKYFLRPTKQKKF